MHLFRARRAFYFRSAVDTGHLFCAQAHTYSKGIHRGVTSTYDDDMLTQWQWSINVRKFAGTHQVTAREKFIRGKNAVKGIAGDIKHCWISGASTDKDRVESHFFDHLLDRKEPPDEHIALEPDSQFFQLIDLGIDHGIW